MKLYLLEETSQTELPISLEISLKRLLQRVKEPSPGPDELALALIYILMLETGFSPTESVYENDENYGFDVRHVTANCESAQDWTITVDGNYETTFCLKPTDYDVTLLVSKFGTNLIVNVFAAPELENVYSQAIPVPKYVLNTPGMSGKFNNLRELSIEFKNHISYRIKSEIFNAEDIFFASFENLPFEVLFKIAMLLPLTSFMNFIQTCSRFNELDKSKNIWLAFAKQLNECSGIGTVGAHVTQTAGNWKTYCKEIVMQKRRSTVRNKFNYVPDIM